MGKPIDDDQDADDAGADEASARETVAKITDPDPTKDLPMHVSEDGTVTFGNADARGEKTARADDDGDEEAADPNMTDAQREALREKRRQEKRRRRDAQRQRETELRGENASLKQHTQELSQRLQQLEQRTTGIDMARLDEELNGAKYAYTSWSSVFDEAVKSNDGPGARAAMEKMNAAREEGQRLLQTKQAFETQAGQPVRKGIDPAVQSRIDNWRKDHKWYNPTKRDRDTRIALAIDDDVAADGYHPATDEFWSELDKRLKEVLPHRYETQRDDDDDDAGEDPAPRGGKRRDGTSDSARSGTTTRRVPAAGGGSGGGSSAPGFTLSKERVQAMKDAGVWNDQKKKEAQIRGYMEYDRAQKARGG